MAKKTRTPKLNKVQMHYLKTNPDGLTNEKLAEELGVSVATVYNHLKKDKPKVEQDVTTLESENQRLRERVKELETPAPVSQPSFDANIGKAFKKGKQVAVIMTPNAAEFADVTEASHRGQPGKLQDCIFQCKTQKDSLPRGRI